MTARELINALLDSKMDERVILYLPEPGIDDNGELFEGYVFDIESVKKNEIVFLDWRKPENERLKRLSKGWLEEKKALKDKLNKIEQIVNKQTILPEGAYPKLKKIKKVLEQE